MFLRELRDKAAYKTLFLECAYILFEVGNKNSLFREINDSCNSAGFFSNNNILSILEPYINELDNAIVRDSFLDQISATKRKYYNFIRRSLDGDKYEIEDSNVKILDMLHRAENHNNVFSGLGSIFNEYMDSTLDKYKSSLEVREIFLKKILDEKLIDNDPEGWFIEKNFEVSYSYLQDFIDKGDDLSEADLQSVIEEYGIEQIDKNRLIRKEFFALPKRKIEVLQQVLEIVLKSKVNFLTDISNKEKKIIIYELVRLCLTYSQLDEGEILFIKKVCQFLQVDFDYVEEFKDVIEKSLAVNKEAKELIYE